MANVRETLEWILDPNSDWRCNGTLASTLAGTDTNASVTVTSVITGPSAPSSPVDAYNADFKWAAASGKHCKIEYNYGESRWELYQMECP